MLSQRDKRSAMFSCRTGRTCLCKVLYISTLLLIFNLGFSWPVLHKIPPGHGYQYFILNADGSYYFGYDIREGSAAKQVSGFTNQVYGHYPYNEKPAEDVEVNYPAHTQELVPTGPDIYPNIFKTDNAYSTLKLFGTAPQNVEKPISHNLKPGQSEETSDLKESQDINPNSDSRFIKEDGSYSFVYSTHHAHREESLDADKNVKGKYSYKDDAGDHDLFYEAGDEIGFLVTGGNLAKPNGLRDLPKPKSDYVVFYSLPFESSSNDSSYSFEYSTPFHSRQEIGDSKGTVYGRYSFVNEAGTHDLRYVAGSDTGFLPIGGSLVESQSSVVSSRSLKGKQISSENNPEGYADLHLPLKVKNAHHTGSSSRSHILKLDDIKNYEYLKDKQDLSVRIETRPTQENTTGFRYAQDYKTQDLGAGRKVQSNLITKGLTGGHDFNYFANGEVIGYLPTVSYLKDVQGSNNEKTKIPSFKSSLNEDVAIKNSPVVGDAQAVLSSVIVNGYDPINCRQRGGCIYNAL